jgi:hypothetical protein
MLNRLLAATRRLRAKLSSELGQTTAEYALVILGAAAVATMLITWATKSDAVTNLFDSVVSKILP